MARRGSVQRNECVAFQHGKESYTLRQYSEMYKGALPGVVMVTQGFYGGSEMEIMGNGQVLRVHTCVNQRRAVATDTHKRTLSVPLNYPLKFRTLDHKDRASKDEDSLNGIVARKPLPVKIQISDSKNITFSWSSGGESNLQRTDSLGPLLVSEVYEETYFLCNTICNTDGKLDKTATLVPLYLGDVLVSPITGIEGQSQSEWEDYLLRLKSDCKQAKIPLDTGLQEIAIFSPNSIKASENIYEYIEPSSYIVSNWEGKSSNDAQYATKCSIKPPTLKPKPKTKPTNYDGPPPAVPARQAKPAALQSTFSSSDKSNPPYANTSVGRATVAPFNKIAQDAAKAATTMGKQSKSGETNPEASKEREEKTVKDLSVEELAAKLKELKLEKYCKCFKENGVDGVLASELDETILQDDFNFSKFDSLKFMKFVRAGHIPK